MAQTAPTRSSAPTRLRRRRGVASFRRLLLLLVVVLAFYPVLASQLIALRFVSLVVSITLIGLLVTVTRNRLTIGAAVGLALVQELLGLWGPRAGLELLVVRDLALVGFMAVCSGVIVSALWREEDVTTDTILGGASVYLMLGIVWAAVYGVVELLVPGSFLLNTADPDSAVLDVGRANLLYYSYVTLTTLGYGDIVPASPVTAGLSALEAVTGQLFIAVLVARIVGIHIAQRSR